MRYRIELRDREMNFITILDNRITDLSWSFSPVGGCAEFAFKVLSKYCTELDLGALFNVRIYKRNDSTKNYDLIYQGRIENQSPSVQFTQEDMAIQGYGYQSALSDILVTQTFTTTEISQIVKSLLDNHIVPNTDITYDLADLETTGFTPPSIVFSYVSAQEAIQKLAEIAGGIEWGVDANRKLYFKQRNTVNERKYFLGKNVKNFKMNSSSREIINRVTVIGADVAGSKFVYTKDYLKNQAKYKRKDALVQNSAVKDNTTAEQLADAKQAEGNGVVDRGSVTLTDELIQETSIPLPLLRIDTREILYDEKEYDTFLYAGQPAFRIRKIAYNLDDASNLMTTIEFGSPLPDIVENIKQLKYSLNNIIQSEA